MPFIVATYVYASSQGQRTPSARTNVCYAFVWRGDKNGCTHLQLFYYTVYNYLAPIEVSLTLSDNIWITLSKYSGVYRVAPTNEIYQMVV
jgi:hypothetical protein